MQQIRTPSVSVTKPPDKQAGPVFVSGYLPSLDGVRGVSILLVVLVHAFLPDIRANGVGGAFVGVNTFFVLSGFLITSLLLAEWEQERRISLTRFYIRRALRLLPALALMLATFIVWNSLFGPPGSGLATFKDALLPICYVANWTRALGCDRPVLFAHTWSLSIEEQFYVLWPLTLLLLLRRTPSRLSLLYWLILGIVGVAVYRVLLVVGGASAERVFNGTDTRADALLVGCCLAACLSLRNRGEADSGLALLKPVAWGAVAALGYLSFRHDFNRPFAEMLLFPISSLCAGLLILEAAVHQSGLVSRVLSQSWLVFVGRVSYGLYLWHAAVFRSVFGRGLERGTELAIALPLTIVATIGSYYLLERPILRFKNRFAAVH